MKAVLRDRVYAKDLTLYLIGKTGIDGATYKAVEFYGQAISELSVSGRMTLCNMAIEMGAKSGIVPPDEKTFDFLKKRAAASYEPVYADPDAVYVKEFTYYADDIEPQVACPHQVDNVKPVGEVEGTHIDQVFIGTCTNGRLEDLEVAAAVLKGKKVAVRTIVIPASRTTLLAAIENGTMETLLKAGVTLATPGAGPVLALIREYLGKEKSVFQLQTGTSKAGWEKMVLFISHPLQLQQPRHSQAKLLIQEKFKS